jgi:hypothetical protein
MTQTLGSVGLDNLSSSFIPRNAQSFHVATTKKKKVNHIIVGLLLSNMLYWMSIQTLLFRFVCLFVLWDLELGAYTLNHSTSPFL